MVRQVNLDPEELEELHAKARRKTIECAAMGNYSGMQAYALMLIADALMMAAVNGTPLIVTGPPAPREP